jgi:hypothetical protein
LRREEEEEGVRELELNGAFLSLFSLFSLSSQKEKRRKNHF